MQVSSHASVAKTAPVRSARTLPFSHPRTRSVVRATVADLEKSAEASSAERKDRKLGPLERGGTLSGEAAAGKDAGDAAKKAVAVKLTYTFYNQIVDGLYKDDRWVEGRWDYSHPYFRAATGETDWDKVIDAEIARRKLLEDSPIPCRNDDVVNFDTAEVPWTAWIKRFHLPEAEKLNGRAAMLGYVLAGAVDLLSGAGLVEQQESFLGKLALHLCVFGVLLVRSTADLDKYKNLIDEATFYDKQWNATWEGVRRPSEAAAAEKP